MMTQKKLCGIVPPLVTPLLAQDKLDVEGLERLINHVIEGGVHGIFILGTTGEGPSLSYPLRREIIQKSIELADGRVPVLVGVTDTCYSAALEMTEFCAEQGAHSVVLSAPYYFPIGEAELLEYLNHFISASALPVFMYNMPSHTKALFTPEIVKEIAQNPNVMGLKDSSANMIYFHQIRSLTESIPGFSLFVGPEELLAESIAFGADGGVCGGANLFPRLYVDLYEAAQRGDQQLVRELHSKVMNVRDSIYSLGKYSSAIIKGLKCALSIHGVCSDTMAEPFQHFRQNEREIITKRLESLTQLMQVQNGNA